MIAESVAGRQRTGAAINRFLNACEVNELLSDATARRAGELRARARTGSVVDAVVVALAERGGTVLTTDRRDLQALAASAVDVAIEVV